MDKCPRINPRRPLDDIDPNGYRESNRDWIDNNLDAVLYLLERELNRQERKR